MGSRATGAELSAEVPTHRRAPSGQRSRASTQVSRRRDKSHGTEGGHLAIGWEPLVELGSVPRVIHGLRKQYPDMHIEIRTLVTRDLLRALRDGRIDAAFVSPPEPQDDLAVHVIEREPLLAVLPDDHRLANCAS